MHTCAPPSSAMDAWLTVYPGTNGSYGHLLLEESGSRDDSLVGALRPYFESAHLDAREYFHEQMGIELHPDADASVAHATYPGCLDSTTRRGLFGEVMAGLVTEHYQSKYVGEHPWYIPVYLFRFHEDVEQYLFAFARDARRLRATYGRRGSDFLALVLDSDGAVTRFIAGEAKWRAALRKSAVDKLMLDLIDCPDTGDKIPSGKGIWAQLNTDMGVPHGLRQLQRILRDREPDAFSATILSLDKILTAQNPVVVPRTNLVVIVGNDVPSRGGEGHSLIPWKKCPEDYKAPHDLQIVEVILNDGEHLIDAVYDSLWAR
ncbi:aminotransferase [Bradyrhizobium diazoefficiens]|nr:aminotransferase [Bradyrhizobium diazoefficiens]